LTAGTCRGKIKCESALHVQVAGLSIVKSVVRYTEGTITYKYNYCCRICKGIDCALIFSFSMEIYNKALEAQKKSEQLQERQQRLSALLHSEARQYETELAGQKGHQGGHHQIPLEELQSVNYELKRRDEDNQRRERELKLYHQWRMKQPSIREVSVIL